MNQMNSTTKNIDKHKNKIFLLCFFREHFTPSSFYKDKEFILYERELNLEFIGKTVLRFKKFKLTDLKVFKVFDKES